jgi:hypothetical protein
VKHTADIVVAKKSEGNAVRIVLVGRSELIQIEAMRVQLTFNSNPACRRVRVIQMRGFAIKSFPPVLFLKRSIGQADMGLLSGLAFLEGIHAVSCFIG